MKTILKIVASGVILFVLLMVALVACLGGAVNEVDKEIKRDQAEYGMSQKEFRSVELGQTYKQFIQAYGEPDPEQTQRTEVDGMKMLTVYFHIEDGDLLDMYQFSFTNGRLDSKSEF